MPQAKLTKRVVDGLSPGPATVLYFDTDLPGFGLRITSSDARAWIVQYRPHGGGRGQTARRMTLGSTSALTPEYRREMIKVFAKRTVMEAVGS